HAVPGGDVARALDEAGIPPERLRPDRALEELAELVAAADRPGARAVFDWLSENRPAPTETPSVCHGDFWYGNLMWSRRGPYLIDWTQAGLGRRELDLGWMSIQHYSRLPLPVPDPWFDWIWVPVRPFVWSFMAPVRWIYRLIGRADRQLIDYFAALCALRLLAHGEFLRKRMGDGPRPAELAAWGSEHTNALLCWRLRRITGVEIR
ncbi:MAG: phosphotransferase, partial [Myxococcota bacterium]